MALEILTKEDLELFKNELIQEIRELIAEKNVKEIRKKWVKSADVMKLLRVSPGTLLTMRTDGRLPYSKIGATLYYDLNDIESILQGNKLKAYQESFDDEK